MDPRKNTPPAPPAETCAEDPVEASRRRLFEVVFAHRPEAPAARAFRRDIPGKGRRDLPQMSP